MYAEIHQHGSYIILISGLCKEWEKHVTRYLLQLYEMFVGKNKRHSWDPRAKFVVPVMSNCTHMQNTKFSKVILKELWLKEVMKAAVLFLKSNEHGGNDLQQNTTDSTQVTYFELHTWYPYENSKRCNPAGGTVPVKVFTVRNLSDIRRSDIFRGYFVKNFHGCPMKVYVRELPPLVYPPKRDWYKDIYNQKVYADGWEIETIRITGNTLIVSMVIADIFEVLDIVSAGRGKEFERLKGQPFIFVGMFPAVNLDLDNFCEYTSSYVTVRFVWYTPCAVKYQR